MSLAWLFHQFAGHVSASQIFVEDPEGTTALFIRRYIDKHYEQEEAKESLVTIFGGTKADAAPTEAEEEAALRLPEEKGLPVSESLAERRDRRLYRLQLITTLSFFSPQHLKDKRFLSRGIVPGRVPPPPFMHEPQAPQQVEMQELERDKQARAYKTPATRQNLDNFWEGVETGFPLLCNSLTNLGQVLVTALVKGFVVFFSVYAASRAMASAQGSVEVTRECLPKVGVGTTLATELVAYPAAETTGAGNVICNVPMCSNLAGGSLYAPGRCM